MKYKHAELIKAWADGAVVEWKCSQGGTWHQLEDIMSLVKYDSVEYRIKPEPKPDFEIFYFYKNGELLSASYENKDPNLKLIFTGEGKLKDAEVIND